MGANTGLNGDAKNTEALRTGSLFAAAVLLSRGRRVGQTTRAGRGQVPLLIDYCKIGLKIVNVNAASGIALHKIFIDL